MLEKFRIQYEKFGCLPKTLVRSVNWNVDEENKVLELTMTYFGGSGFSQDFSNSKKQ